MKIYSPEWDNFQDSEKVYSTLGQFPSKVATLTPCEKVYKLKYKFKKINTIVICQNLVITILKYLCFTCIWMGVHEIIILLTSLPSKTGQNALAERTSRAWKSFRCCLNHVVQYEIV